MLSNFRGTNFILFFCSPHSLPPSIPPTTTSGHPSSLHYSRSQMFLFASVSFTHFPFSFPPSFLSFLLIQTFHLASFLSFFSSSLPLSRLVVSSRPNALLSHSSSLLFICPCTLSPDSRSFLHFTFVLYPFSFFPHSFLRSLFHIRATLFPPFFFFPGCPRRLLSSHSPPFDPRY